MLTEALAAVTATGEGRLVLISGEAGIGKTALVQEFTAGLDGVRSLSGACEALTTPRPLGPLHDIAAETGGELAAALERGASAGEALTPLLAELRSPTVLVLEYVHWADEAGELPPRAMTRIVLRPLSPDAVETLARPHRVDASGLFERTAGNPFYVTEALAAGGAHPDSVRDAVHARAARLREDARRLLDAVAIAPPRAELWLLEAVAGDDLSALDACIAAGMHHEEGDAVAFRHEIARVAIEEAMAPHRRLALNRRALPALAATTYDLTRLAHHAEAAGDGAAVRRRPAAGDRAAALGAHREAAEQFARALRFGDRLPGEECADLLERRSFECYLTYALDEARALAMVTMEPQRVVPVAAARAEARLLGGEPERVAEELGDALALTASHGQGWAAGELCVLGRRAGLDLVPPVEPAEPYRLELAGEHEAAAKAWRSLGCPYEAALAELAAGHDDAQTELNALGARCDA